MDEFKINLTSTGMLMSIFAITGLLIALPAGLFLQRFGLKVTVVSAAGSLLTGSVIGAMSNDFDLLFASRLVEGIGMGLIAVAGPAVISAWFPTERRGLPMGIWATWVSLGSLLVYIIAPAVEGKFGWQSVWWLSAAATGAALVLFALFFRLPPGAKNDRKAEASFAWEIVRRVFMHRDIRRLSLAFACFNFAVIGVIATYYPTFLKAIHGYDLAGASQVTSIKMVVVILTAPAAGWLIGKTGSPRQVMLWSYAAMAVYMALPFSVSGWMIPVSMVLLGLLAGAIPAFTLMAATQESGREIPAGLAMAMILTGQNLGQLLGPVVFGALVQVLGWTAAGLLTIPVLLFGLLAIERTTMK